MLSDLQLEGRVRYLPEQIDRTRAKLRALEAEARRYGMIELLGDTDRSAAA